MFLVDQAFTTGVSGKILAILIEVATEEPSHS
jgi:hypothetical protein